jgi:hypothetical protein
MGGSCCRSSPRPAQAFELAIPARTRNRQLPASTEPLEWRFLQAETSTACVHVAGGGDTQHGANVDDRPVLGRVATCGWVPCWLAAVKRIDLTRHPINSKVCKEDDLTVSICTWRWRRFQEDSAAYECQSDRCRRLTGTTTLGCLSHT